MAISKGPGTWGGEQAPDLSPAAQHTQSCSLASAKGLGAPRELAQNETSLLNPNGEEKRGERKRRERFQQGTRDKL